MTKNEGNIISNTYGVVFLLLWMSSLAVSSLLFHHVRKHMYIAKTGMNPFKLMWKVLTFAWKNKYPLNRSAFTCCEDHTPSRLDLGKEQYGGPFTTEEVEDVKTFFRLILLLLTLFRYHISGDGFSIANYIRKYSCPSSSVTRFVVVKDTGYLL